MTEDQNVIQDQIDILEATAISEESSSDTTSMEGEDENLGDLFGDNSSVDFGESDFTSGGDTSSTDTASTDSTTSTDETSLPSPADLGAGDFSDSSNPELN